ncbi:uncharacterized protein LOC115631306 [Scaptodrosophila lebanonensis]|uniref:Uncharacterized protein LOC115631306 n=1 Tax=Drosophila lebanonensis TaxID=7225 RepID=A0A6J2U5P1_DROLE|nr:uncharacterized protein LOC115631306 [Scaptodrosophila lebanonensis]
MSKQFVLSSKAAIYRTTYELPADNDERLLQRAAIKAAELHVCGYITHTHSGRKVGGELEGSATSLEQMMSWLRDEIMPKEAREQPRFAECLPQEKSKYQNFFYV